MGWVSLGGGISQNNESDIGSKSSVQVMEQVCIASSKVELFCNFCRDRTSDTILATPCLRGDKSG